MADQAINALPTKTSPTTGDKMLMIGAAEEYQIDYDQLATAILNKLTSKTFTLDQGTKTLVAALNELNSKTQSFYTEGSESTSAIPVKYGNKYFCVAAQQGAEGLSNTARVFVLEISNDLKNTNITNIFGTTLAVSVKLNDGAVTFTFGSSYIKLLMINIDHA